MACMKIQIFSLFYVCVHWLSQVLLCGSRTIFSGGRWRKLEAATWKSFITITKNCEQLTIFDDHELGCSDGVHTNTTYSYFKTKGQAMLSPCESRDRFHDASWWTALHRRYSAWFVSESLLVVCRKTNGCKCQWLTYLITPFCHCGRWN